MSDVLLGLIGAVAGLIVALFINLAVLPFVIKRQQASMRNDWKMPIFGWDKARIMKLTKFSYRVQMPILFACVGAVMAVLEFGSSR